LDNLPVNPLTNWKIVATGSWEYAILVYQKPSFKALVIVVEE
jgi:hypothetical protein